MAATADTFHMETTNGNSSANVKDATLQLVVLHGKRSYTIDNIDPQTTTVGDLRTKLFNVSSVPQSLQKLIVKGKGMLTKNDQTLAQVGFRNKGKITMIGNPLSKVVGATTGVDLSPRKKREEKTQEEQKRPNRWSQTKEHERMVEKGVPDNAEKGVKDKNFGLPKSIKGVTNNKGEPVRLTFRSDAQELWIASKERTEKISYLQVKDVVSDPIHLDETYHIVALQIGPMPKDLLYFYWVPAQYVRSIKYTLLSMGAGANLLSVLSDNAME